MYSVIGYLDEVAYTVNVDTDAAGDGVLDGSARIVSWLNTNVGAPVRATPTSTTVILDLADPVSILAALHEHTQVTEVRGAAPDLHPRLRGELPDTADAIY